MPRVGQNPMRWVKDVHQPEKVTVTTIVHIPYLEGYWAQSLEVLKLCLQSMRENTQIPFDLMVFDNGSCVEVQDYLLSLRRKGDIQYLVLSEHNIGKAGAWNVLFSAAPGEIISYTDSDVYFLPGWLEASLEVLEAFPEAGIITAQPIVGPLSPARSSTLEAAQKDPTISIREGNGLVPEKYVDALRKSLGETPEAFEHRVRGRRDVLLSRGTVSAYVSASHFQFTTFGQVLRSVLPLETTIPLGDDDLQLDYGLLQAGFWRLSTTEYLVHHMGNRLPDFQNELEWVRTENIAPKMTFKRKHSHRAKFSQKNFVRRILKYLNTVSYSLLYEETELSKEN
jgi:glycosyltransferase involved in cell wall biosynthesis